MNPVSQLALVNPEFLTPLIRMAGADRVRGIVEAFWASADELLNEYDRATASGDAETAYRAAHSLKGAASNVGAEQIAAIAKDLQTADGETRARLRAEVDAAVEATRPKIEALLQAA